VNGWTVFVAILALTLATGVWAQRAERLAAPVPVEIALPLVEGWSLSNEPPQVWWEPRAEGADHRLLGSYVDGAGHRVDVFYAFYASQGETKDAGGFGQGALVPDTDWRWLKPGPAIANASSEVLLAQGRVVRLAATYYRQ